MPSKNVQHLFRFSDYEMGLLVELADKQDESRVTIIRRGLRLYHQLNKELTSGGKLLIEREDGNVIELILL